MNQEQQPQIKVGDKVHWTHVGGNKRILSIQRREGVVEEIKGDVALIRRGKRLVEVALARVRAMNQKSQVTETAVELEVIRITRERTNDAI